MKSNKTKEKILIESLNLFSTRGYEAVSVRDIGRAVGIRESSIYKHYSGKQAIFDAIVQMAKQRIETMLEQLEVPDENDDRSMERYLLMEPEQVAEMCTEAMRKQMEDEVVSRFRRVLTIEQYRREELRQIFLECFMDRPLIYVEKVFRYLLNHNILKGKDPEKMAIEFFSPFFMLQYKYYGQEQQETLIQLLKEHTIHFIQIHFVLKEG